jgi:hypothetical protein
MCDNGALRSAWRPLHRSMHLFGHRTGVGCPHAYLVVAAPAQHIHLWLGFSSLGIHRFLDSGTSRVTSSYSSYGLVVGHRSQVGCSWWLRRMDASAWCGTSLAWRVRLASYGRSTNSSKWWAISMLMEDATSRVRAGFFGREDGERTTSIYSLHYI